MRRFFTVAVLVLCLAQPAFAGTYLVFQDRGGTWCDADKDLSGRDDSMMCWAAAAANVLKWGHWDTADHDTEASIFESFQKHWRNGTGSPTVGWQWWFNGRSTPGSPTQHAGNKDLSYNFGKSGTQLKDGAAGGDYWHSYDFRQYLHQEADPSRTMEAVDSFLHKGYGVVVGVERPKKSIGHVLTVWGVETDETGAFQGIYTTNSDDGGHKLVYLPVSWSERKRRWKVESLDGYIREVWALEPRPA